MPYEGEGLVEVGEEREVAEEENPFHLVLGCRGRLAQLRGAVWVMSFLGGWI